MTAAGREEPFVAHLNDRGVDGSDARRNQGPLEYLPSFSPRGEEAELQPQRVLVLLKHYLESGAGETQKPAQSRWRKSVDLLCGQWMETATKPGAGVVKGNRLQGS